MTTEVQEKVTDKVTRKGNYFSIKRDHEVIDAGGFYCCSCLVGRPLDDRSPDLRYCQGCYDIMAAEKDFLRPQKAVAGTVQNTGQTIQAVKKTCNKNKAVEIPNMPTDGIYDTSEKRGRPAKDVSAQLVMDLAGAGLVTREIAKRVGVSHSTIARTLKKSRQGKDR